MPQNLLTRQLKEKLTYRVWCLYSSFVHDVHVGVELLDFVLRVSLQYFNLHFAWQWLATVSNFYNNFPFVKMSQQTLGKIQHLEGSLEMTLSWGIFLPFILEENLGDSGRRRGG
jgi:hypothetical protein